LVEDNYINREIGKALLESFGATVATASDGLAAIECCVNAPPDIVVMDLQMPVMDGIAAIRKLRDLGISTPIICLTANAFAEDGQKCLDAGMDEFLAKPVSRAKIASIFGSFCQPKTPCKDVDLLDMPKLNYVRVEMGDSLFAVLLDHLTAEDHDFLAGSRESGDQNEGQRTDAASHSLKGAASTLGFTKVAKFAQDFREHKHVERQGICDLITLIDQSVAQAKSLMAPR
jgi:CheY-like chemotaxis protein